MVLRPNRTLHRWLLDEAERDRRRPAARYYAEQGFFHERSFPWKRLPAGFNMQKKWWPWGWRPRLRGPVNSTDYYLHKKFWEVPSRVRFKLGVGLTETCGTTMDDSTYRAAVGECYISRRLGISGASIYNVK